MVDGADFTGAVLGGATLDPAHGAQAKGIDPATTAAGAIGPNARELESVANQSKLVEITAKVQTPAGPATLDLTAYGSKEVNPIISGAVEWWGGYGNVLGGSARPTVTHAMWEMAQRLAGGQLRIESIAVKRRNCPLSTKELRSLAVAAWCEVFGVEAPSEEEIKERAKKAQQEKATAREEWIATLRSGKAGVAKWNALPDLQRAQVSDLRGADLSGASLAGVNFRGVDLREANLQNARLTGADLYMTNFTKANLSGAQLMKFFGFPVIFQEADLTGANMKDANFAEIVFDEHTLFPQGFTIPDDATWVGKGPDPRLADQFAQLKRSGPIDMPAFMERLKLSTDRSRLQKAKQMLKAERFQLFAQVEENSVVGVVKSQTDRQLVYSCRLDDQGSFTCRTQNLNPCGGLRGAPCKHLLVLVVGLAKSGELDPAKVDRWIQASRYRKPVLDKDKMGEIFLRYKGAEAGELDWRPTETAPEDFYAF